MADLERVVIIGGGLAAARAAESIRAEGFGGDLVLITAENQLPYERPPLSKGYLLGQEPVDVIYPHDAAWYREHRVQVRYENVTGINVDDHLVFLGNEEIRYDRLLLATGARPRRFDGPGAGLQRVQHLRTLEDSIALREELQHHVKRRVVVVGSGWIGLEVAAAAREYGHDVTVVGRGEKPLGSALGTELGEVFARLHADHGVKLRMNASVTAVIGRDGAVGGVVLGTGEELAADLAVFGLGALPNVELAAEAGIHVDDGIVTDQGLATSAPDVYAAGDVASIFHPTLQHHSRVEHWARAGESGTAAGRALAGATVVYDDVPYFFTDQFDLGMEYCGYGELAAQARLVVRGDLAARAFIAFWVREERIVAGMNVNVWDVNEQIQNMIRSRTRVSERALADATVPLSAVAK